MNLGSYALEGFHDEMFVEAGVPRPGASLLARRLETMSPEELANRQRAAERTLLHLGITFTVYGDDAGTERIFPFDVIPRIVSAKEWTMLERGLRQRIHALNLFLDDIYGEQRILKEGVIPAEVIRSARSYRQVCQGLKPPGGVWCHITGTDLVRGGDGRMYVLEDNLRCPSGVSYVLENRRVMKSTFPQVFERPRCGRWPTTRGELLDVLQYIAPGDTPSPTRGAADARRLQLRLLRARLPGPADGH
jgi:uncharacterized circularly permuted ATP-grasp superfamily protein